MKLDESDRKRAQAWLERRPEWVDLDNQAERERERNRRHYEHRDETDEA